MVHRIVRARWLTLAGCLLLALVSVCGSASGQTVKEEVRLLDKPSGSPQGTPLSAGTAVKVAERQGFWVRVEAGGRSGWVKASGLTFSSGPGGPTAIDTGRLGTGNIVSTSAARGLSAKDLLNGTPRMDEVVKMAQHAPDAATLQAFITQGLVVAPSQPIALKAAEPSPAKQGAVAPDSSRTTSSQPPKTGAKRGTDEW